MSKFDSDNQPDKRRTRGKAFKTKLFDAIKAKALINATEEMDTEEIEQLFIEHLAYEAMKEEKPDLYLLKDLMNRSFPALKPTMDTYNFALDPNTTPSEKAQAILVATAQGDIPPDVGTMLIKASKDALDIEALTELKERILKLEKLYEGQQAE